MRALSFGILLISSWPLLGVDLVLFYLLKLFLVGPCECLSFLPPLFLSPPSSFTHIETQKKEKKKERKKILFSGSQSNLEWGKGGRHEIRGNPLFQNEKKYLRKCNGQKKLEPSSRRCETGPVNLAADYLIVTIEINRLNDIPLM